MAQPVAMGAMCQCAFGVAPCPITVSSQQTCVSGAMPLATIKDTAGLMFGMCSSLLNPAVAATITPVGTFTPMPCAPVFVGVWAPGSPTVLVGGTPALNANSMLTCAYGGVIKISLSKIFTVQVP